MVEGKNTERLKSRIAMVEERKTDVHTELLEELCKVCELWERMDMVLQAEWKVLLENDLARLIKISRIKQELSDRIKDRERELKSLFMSFIPDSCEKGPNKLWDAIRQVMPSNEARRLLLQLRKRDYFRQLVLITNNRISYWIRERLGFFHELSSILSGAGLRKTPTYGPEKSIKKNVSHFTKPSHFSRLNLSSASLKNGLAMYQSQARGNA